MIYRFLRLLFGLATRAFFREITLENFDRIPESGPILLLPNHPNGLVDPFLILINLKRPVSLTAKATLKKNPLIALLFKAGNVVALQRRQDAAEGADMSKNAEALAEARRRLKDGGAVCLFPEGISHNEPQVQPLKTGAARIALEYVDVDGNPGGLKIVPVGLDYFDKQGFRSSVHVRVAEPIDAGTWRAENPQGDPHALMDAVDLRLRENTLNFEKRKESVIIGFAAELLLTRGAEPGRVGEERAQGRALLGTIEALQRGYEANKDGKGPEIEALGARIRALMARLRRLGVHPREVFIEVGFAPALLFCLREFAAVLLGLPLALWGMLNHILPYAFCVAVKNQFGRERDVRATYAIFGAVLAFPLYYLLALGTLFYRLPFALAMAWTLSMPLSLWAWLKFRDHFMAVFKRSATFLLFVARPGLRRELVAEERAILAQISEFSAS